MKLPAGAEGKQVVEEYADLLNGWTRRTNQELISLDLATIFPPLILQRPPCKHVPAATVKKLVNERIKKWKQGQITAGREAKSRKASAITSKPKTQSTETESSPV